MREVDEPKVDEAGPKRRLGALTAFSLVVASMVGTGVFSTTGVLVADLPSTPGILLCWLVGGLAALCGALAYAGLGAAFASNGGEYHFLARLVHPAVGFLSAFVSLLVGFAAPLAAVALSFGHYLGAMGIAIDPRVSGGALIIGLSALNAWRVSAGASFQNVFTLGKVALIVAFVLLGLPRGDMNLLAAGKPLGEVVATSGFAAGLLQISFAYTGWNAAVYVAGEVKEPEKVLPKALLTGTLAVKILYVALNAVFLAAGPLSAVQGKVEVGHIAATSLFGDRGGRVLSAIIALGLVSTVGAMLVTGPRIYEAVGRDVPRLAFLAHRPEGGGPVWGVVIQAVLAIAMMLVAQFDVLLSYIGFTLSIFAALAVGCVFLVRRRGLALPYRMPGYPVTPVIFLLLMAWMIVSGVLVKPTAALAGGVTLVAGLLVYRFTRGNEVD